MTILYIDAMAGIAGDMTAAALLDLGVPLVYMTGQIETLQMPDRYTITTGCLVRHGMRGLYFRVVEEGAEHVEGHHNHHDHHNHDCHNHHDHGGSGHHEHHQHSHHHRSYAAIREMLMQAQLEPGVQQRALAMFRVLAEAEGRAHGIDVEQVQFHEVGALDSIIDIVAVAAGLNWLGVDQIFVSAVPMGGGMVKTAHGLLSVPAPATIDLLRGFSLHTAYSHGERVTPTGAAILAALATPAQEMPVWQMQKSGCGAGSMDFGDGANMVRCVLGEVPQKANNNKIYEMACTVDDCTAEVLGYLQPVLLAAGALDVWVTPAMMKKQRPGHVISLLAEEHNLLNLAGILQQETGSLGVRWHQVERQCVERQVEKRQTTFGVVRYKVSPLGATPEYEDAKRIAEDLQIPLRKVMQALMEGCDGKL